MNGYPLVIDISSDEENNRCSTPLKRLPLNMVGTPSDSSVEIWRGREAELDSTFESDCSPRKFAPTPKKKKKLGKVGINLPSTGSPASATDFYEEPDTSKCQCQFPPPKSAAILKEKPSIPQLGNERATGTSVMNDLSKPTLAELEELYDLDLEDRKYYETVGRGRGRHATKSTSPRQPHLKEIVHSTEALNDLGKHTECSPEEQERLEKMILEMEQEEMEIAYMTAVKGRGPHQARSYSCRPQ